MLSCFKTKRDHRNVFIRNWWEFLHFIHMLEGNIFYDPQVYNKLPLRVLFCFQTVTNSKESLFFTRFLFIKWSLIFPTNRTILKGNSFLLQNLFFQELHAISGKQAAAGTQSFSCLGDIHISWLLRYEKRNILEKDSLWIKSFWEVVIQFNTDPSWSEVQYLCTKFLKPSIPKFLLFFCLMFFNIQ